MDKILTLYLDPHVGHPDLKIPVRLTYKGYPLQMTQQDYDDLISVIPEFWYTENDKITLFTLFADKNYYCERQKKIYNYSTKTFETVPYRFDSVDEIQLKEFVDILITFFDKINLRNQRDIEERLISSIQDYSIVENFVLNIRQYILTKTDYMFMSDYPSSDEKKQKWAEYRQNWRDVTKQEAWKEGNLHQVILPISPEETTGYTFNAIYDTGFSVPEIEKYLAFNQKTENVENYEENIKTVVSKYCEYALKSNIISAISRFRMPSIDSSLNTFYDDELLFYDNFVSNFDDFSKKVDEQLKKLNSDLTIESLISRYKNKDNISEEVANILSELLESQEQQ
jgi:hypothetical protein